MLSTKRSASKNFQRIDYNAYLDGKIRKGEHFAKPRCYFGLFTSEQSDLLCHLMNCGRRTADEQGFIPATTSFIQQGLKFSPNTQEHLIRSLEKMGVIQVEMRGKIRYIRIDHHRIDKLIARGGSTVSAGGFGFREVC